MELHKGDLYWPETVYQASDFKKTEASGMYDAVIVGGGMSGALAAVIAAERGMRVALIEGHEIGSGSTSANTGLLQFSNDIMLHELMAQIGDHQAVEFYSACQKALDDLEKLAGQLQEDPAFIRRSSLYYASTEQDADKLKKEAQVLQKYGFSAEYWERTRIASGFSFAKPAAIVTHGDAEVNPLKLGRGVAKRAESLGAEVYENTRVKQVARDGEELLLHTSRGAFRAQNVIFATGYGSTPYVQNSEKEIHRTYAIATEPVGAFNGWPDRMMIWETKRPYLYARTTLDNRIIVGGLDQDRADLPHDKRILDEKAARLLRMLRTLFPEIPVRLSHAWAALFGESEDNLPMIGRHPSEEGVYYLLGLGGNGTTCSMIGARLLADLMEDRPNAMTDILKLDGRGVFHPLPRC